MMSRGKVLRLRTISLLLAIGVLQACVSQFSGADGPELGNGKQPGIVAIGASLMQWNALSGNSTAQVISKNLNEPVVDRSQVGSAMLFNKMRAKVPQLAYRNSIFLKTGTGPS